MPQGQTVEKIRLRGGRTEHAPALRMRRIKEAISNACEDTAETLARLAHGPQQRLDRGAVLVVKLLVRLRALWGALFRTQGPHERRVAQ